MDRPREKSSKKPREKPGKETRPLFYRVAMFLYKKACIRKLPIFSSSQVETDLIQLYPGENIQWIKTDFYVRKLALSMTILLVGILLGMAAKYSASSKALLEEDRIIRRGSYEEGEQEVVLRAAIREECQEFQIYLGPREFSQQELEEAAGQLLEQLPELILGENDSLEQIWGELDLEEAYEGYPFELEWESSRPDIVSASGMVEMQEEPVEVELKVKLLCQEYKKEDRIALIVASPVLSPWETEHRNLEAYLLMEEENSRQQEDWILPDQWQGEEITWSRKTEDRSLLLWAAAIAAAVLVYLMKDRDLHSCLEKRRKALKREYPDIVHQLVLYVGAGMTVRGAFQRIAEEYEKKSKKRKKAGRAKRTMRAGEDMPGHEEIIYTCRELFSGVSEGAAYEHFGRRTGLQEYIRLSTLLIQNLKRGNRDLLERLREESQKAGEEKLQQGRKLGEEAGTKLLVPMVLMLAIVMILIMVPAFSSL